MADFYFCHKTRGENMFSTLFSDKTKAKAPAHTEGELYKVICAHGQTFRLYYGYYEECDRQNEAVEPMPIYPDFLSDPLYTDTGLPFVTMMQDSCDYYVGKSVGESECADCEFYSHCEELLGICICPQNKITVKEDTK